MEFPRILLEFSEVSRMRRHVGELCGGRAGQPAFDAPGAAIGAFFIESDRVVQAKGGTGRFCALVLSLRAERQPLATGS